MRSWAGDSPTQRAGGCSTHTNAPQSTCCLPGTGPDPEVIFVTL